MNDDDIFQGLNDAQQRAVASAAERLLVVAGPGTGKTLTIVRRIAHLVRKGARPESILAVTFTNRAAREMRERVDGLLGTAGRRAFIGTLHLLGLRLLREAAGGSFTLLDRDEQAAILKPLTAGSDKKARAAAERISRIKNGVDKADEADAGLFARYQEALAEGHAFDFDDLILKPIELLGDPAVRDRFVARFRHLIVDEYQDINGPQYALLRLLAGAGLTVFGVGDADQAIYAFRGADVENFLGFERDFPGADRIALVENYRSSGTILRAADAVIKNNHRRLARELAPTRGAGARISVLSLPDDRAEGSRIVDEIERRMGGTSRYQQYRRGASGEPERALRFADFGVIYRTNAQARALGDAFRASGIPYQVVGRAGAAQAKEIEEMTAYLRSLLAPGDAAAPGLPASEAEGRLEEKLLTEPDYFDPRADAVALLTMHAAKGLEFPVLFIAGCEEGLLPFTINGADVDVEEERRLFYVGMTRAKDELILLCARTRFLAGCRLAAAPSPFLSEIPDEYKTLQTVPDAPKKQKPEDSQMGLFS